jgi:hypothetical protein
MAVAVAVAVAVDVVVTHYILTRAFQFFVSVEQEDWKFDTLCDLCVFLFPLPLANLYAPAHAAFSYDTLTITQAVILCGTKRKLTG